MKNDRKRQFLEIAPIASFAQSKKRRLDVIEVKQDWRRFKNLFFLGCAEPYPEYEVSIIKIFDLPNGNVNYSIARIRSDGGLDQLYYSNTLTAINLNDELKSILQNTTALNFEDLKMTEVLNFFEIGNFIRVNAISFINCDLSQTSTDIINTVKAAFKQNIIRLVLKNTNIANVSEKQWTLFAHAFQHVKLIDLSDNWLDAASNHRLNIFLHRFNQLYGLAMQNIQIGKLKTSIPPFLSSIAHRLGYIDLSRNRFENIKQLFDIIDALADAAHINISYNQVGDYDIKTFKTLMIRSQRAQSIDLPNNALTDTHIPIIKSLLSNQLGFENSRVSHILGLHTNHFSPAGILQLEYLNVTLSKKTVPLKSCLYSFFTKEYHMDSDVLNTIDEFRPNIQIY